MCSLLPEGFPECGCLHVDIPVGVIYVPAEFSTGKEHSARTTNKCAIIVMGTALLYHVMFMQCRAQLFLMSHR